MKHFIIVISKIFVIITIIMVTNKLKDCAIAQTAAKRKSQYEADEHHCNGALGEKRKKEKKLSIQRNMKSANTIAMILSYCCDTVASGLVEKGKVAQCKLEGCAIAETKHKTQYEVGEDHCNRALSEKVATAQTAAWQ